MLRRTLKENLSLKINKLLRKKVKEVQADSEDESSYKFIAAKNVGCNSNLLNKKQIITESIKMNRTKLPSNFKREHI